MTDYLLACALSKWEGDPFHCRWCDKPLEGRQRRWCSEACPKAMARQHVWSDAREAALKRDRRRCVRCRSEGTRTWVGSVLRTTLEVHHKTPCRGKRKAGCQHHVECLETLCHDCHVATHRDENLRMMRALHSVLIDDSENEPPDFSVNEDDLGFGAA